ncbi:MAG TPA: hypothetical protein VHN98_13390, partial [Acidimicrobiales bacterium]|nr:hypothetical protein [Acidimicrobiales bacterium]
PAAAASHRTAARLLDIRQLRSYDGTELAVPGPRLPILRGARARRSTLLEPIDIRPVTPDPARCAIPATRVERTLVDLAAVVPVETLRSALEDALLRGLTTIDRLWSYLTRYGARGRPGVATFRAVLRKRDPSWAPTESGLEDRLVATLERHGVEVPTPQIPIVSLSGKRFRIDRGYDDILLALEVNSVYWHTSPEAQRRDAEKRNALLQLGWHLYIVTEFDLDERPAWLAADIGATVAALRARQSMAAGAHPRLSPPGSANLVA